MRFHFSKKILKKKQVEEYLLFLNIEIFNKGFQSGIALCYDTLTDKHLTYHIHKRW